MNQKNIIIALGMCIVFTGIIWYFASQKQPYQNAQYGTNSEGVICTQDAKQCPDGSHVGRIGPKCEFAACPSATSTQSVAIESISPKIGPIGTQIKVQGSGFASSSLVLFGNGAILPDSINDTVLTFTVPDYLNPVCYYSTPGCALPSWELKPGAYNVSIKNQNGTINAVTFTVTAQQTETGSGIKGNVLLGPTCPVMRNPPDPQCADKPYKVSLIVTTPNSSYAIASFSSDDAGNFKVSVAPGDYEIHSASSSQTPPLCRTGSIHVSQGTFTETIVYCDTGIR